MLFPGIQVQMAIMNSPGADGIPFFISDSLLMQAIFIIIRCHSLAHTGIRFFYLLIPL